MSMAMAALHPWVRTIPDGIIKCRPSAIRQRSIFFFTSSPSDVTIAPECSRLVRLSVSCGDGKQSMHTEKDSSFGKHSISETFLADKLVGVFKVPLVNFGQTLDKAFQPPLPKLCGTESGPPVTAPRVRLKDGRYLAFAEAGVAKENAKYKVVMVHGFGGTRDDFLPASKALIEELGVYFVGFDRAGYGQSDPNPGRSLKSEAYDIEELADLLDLGPKFYVIATSIGGYSAWACLRYIPHRLGGVTMLAPVTNYWWRGIPLWEALKAYGTQPLQDQFAVAVAHYFPSLVYWWNTQPFFPKSSVFEGRTDYRNALDKAMRDKNKAQFAERRAEATRQGVFESLLRDMVIMFSNWDFDPGDLENPFSSNEGRVHIWHGVEDYVVPITLQRYIHRRLPWIHYREVPNAGHYLRGVEGLPDQILRDFFL